MTGPGFLDLPDAGPDAARICLLPLPFEGTVSFGRGTAAAPEAIWRASTQVELWDEELDFPLDSLTYHSAPALTPRDGEPVARYLDRLIRTAARLHRPDTLVIGVGGEHSVTPALVRAAAGEGDWSDLTVVQLDAHADLRDEYDGTPHSHACAMRRLVERGAGLIAIGIRSADRAEVEYGRSSPRVRTFTAQALASDPTVEPELLATLSSLTGRVYLTVDIDAFETGLCPGTGTPQPGGLGWWPALRYLRALLCPSTRAMLLGCDLVETVPQPHTQVNEFVAARLLTKIIAYAVAPGCM
ncbi:MAG: agmatinase [Candidatus Latescibacterota bacterium]|jgi:agmatinase